MRDFKDFDELFTAIKDGEDLWILVQNSNIKKLPIIEVATRQRLQTFKKPSKSENKRFKKFVSAMLDEYKKD